MKLKKFIVCAMATMMVAATTITTFGAEKLSDAEQSIITALKNANVPTEYINQATSYLQKDGVEVTADQATQINAQVETAKATASSVTKLSDLSAAQKKAIADDIAAAGKVVDLTVTYNTSSDAIVIKDATGATVLEATPEVVKPTGANMSTTIAVVAALAVALMGCGVVVSKKRIAESN